MVGDCGQTRHLDSAQSLATRQPSAKMHITKTLVMDWTFWKSVHTGLQRWKSHHQKQNRYKKASDSLRCKHTHASEEFGRARSGRGSDEPEETELQPALASQQRRKFSTPSADGWSPCAVCSGFLGAVAFQLQRIGIRVFCQWLITCCSVLKQRRRFGLAQRV